MNSTMQSLKVTFLNGDEKYRKNLEGVYRKHTSGSQDKGLISYEKDSKDYYLFSVKGKWCMGENNGDAAKALVHLVPHGATNPWDSGSETTWKLPSKPDEFCKLLIETTSVRYCFGM